MDRFIQDFLKIQSLEIAELNSSDLLSLMVFFF